MYVSRETYMTFHVKQKRGGHMNQIRKIKTVEQLQKEVERVKAKLELQKLRKQLRRERRGR